MIVGPLLLSLLSIVLREQATILGRRLGDTCYELSTRFGTPRILFSVVFLFSILAFHRTNGDEYVVLTVSWIVLIGLAPIETLVSVVHRVSAIWMAGRNLHAVGQVVGHELPRILLVRSGTRRLSFGDIILATGCEGQPTIGMCLDHYGYSEGPWQRVYEISQASSDLPIPEHSRVRLAEGEVLQLDSDLATPAILAECPSKEWDRFIGIVGPSTTPERLQVEVLRNNVDLQCGCVVQTVLHGKQGLYQIVNGLTAEEVVHQKNTRGYVRATGRALGCWDEETQRLHRLNWVPDPNSAVFLNQVGQQENQIDGIGCLPNTQFPVRVDPHLLVTHNSAILGILGSGKSCLALELVERMIRAQIKVVCLDLTNQYSKELSPYFNRANLDAEVTGLSAVGSAGRTNVHQNVEDGGSVKSFRTRLNVILQAFLAPAQNDEFVKIFNPAQLEVWRQDSKQYQNNASMASLTPVEITKLITEACLEAVQHLGMTDEARCCLVYEEAHSLVPEWNSTAADVDRTACNGSSKAILQGRKYGLGCLAVTQRTANITKSILNQCNTVFALRTYDSTGIDFLKNYVGDDYAEVLSTLEDRHAVVFGRGISLKEPVIVRLNDRNAFLEKVRHPEDAPEDK